ncbi:UNVERIFIED_CONTAM: hypothetical protein GTU68_005675, partial [Idotea baltica]|nr:hypothetical protein [Idotea baltica]
MVKELRQRTGAGMMECKRALSDSEGDMEKAIEQMRITGLAKADKKSDRTAADGMVVVATTDDNKNVALVEINSETDFVAKGDDFRDFTAAVANAALNNDPADLDALNAADIDGTSVDDARKALIAKIVRKNSEGVIGQYLHGDRIGVVCEVVGGDV